ncbi:MAG: hypothetical protein PHZ09_12830, partial [Eubacteriales bacterium]|nr:hypothetical protein [Eubacteriales bacterium]
TFVSEENADAAIVKYGNPQLCIDAMSKIGCYGYYVRENRYNLFADYETLPEHVCSVNVRHFRDALERRGAAWKDMIKKELPAQLNSHPTFNQRRENLGVNDFNIDISPSHSALTGEWARLAKFTDRRIADRMKQDYGKKRRKFYTRSIDRVKAWEDSDRTRPPEEMRPVIDAYMNLMRVQEAERLCAQTAGRTDNDNAKAYPLFMSGQIKLNACDSGGIGLIRRAIAIKADYTAPGMNLIGEFCRQTGMKAELEAHRAAAPEAIQRAKDTVGRTAVLRRRDRLSPVPDNGDMKAHIDRITGLGQGNVIEIYAVRKTIGDDFFTDAFVIKFKPRLDTEIADELLFDIFCYLDAFPSKNHRSVFAYNKATAFAVKKISKSRVYKA